MYTKPYTTSFLLSFLLHVSVILLILFSLDFSDKTFLTQAAISTTEGPVIQAVSINQSQIAQEMTRLQMEQQHRAETQRSQQEKIQQQKMELQKQQERTAKALAALQTEQQNIARQKAQQATQLEKLQQQKAEWQAKQQQAQEELQRKLAAEQQALAAARTKQIDAVVARYNNLILNAIYPHWIVSEKQKNLSADLLINVATDGTVLHVTLQKSSGSTAFDASAIAAVYKSSPLPVPKDPTAFAVFREFKLTLKPENIKSPAEHSSGV